MKISKLGIVFAAAATLLFIAGCAKKEAPLVSPSKTSMHCRTYHGKTYHGKLGAASAKHDTKK